MRLRSVLASLVMAGCVVPANNPPPQPQYYGPAQQPPAATPPAPSPSPTPPPAYTPPPAPPPQPEPAYTPPQPSQPVYYDDPTYDTINVSVGGESVPSVDVFFDQLDPYGTWYDDPTYGWAFVPSQPGYVPYSNGHWK